MNFAIYTPKDVEDVAALQYIGNNIDAVNAFIFPKKLAKGTSGYVFNNTPLYLYSYVVKDKHGACWIYTENEFLTKYIRDNK
ncbi:MAG: hypothetical protein WDA42_00600 [Candidatus Bathyarchaeia archaeon]|jgi:hypothetical protein